MGDQKTCEYCGAADGKRLIISVYELLEESPFSRIHCTAGHVYCVPCGQRWLALAEKLLCDRYTKPSEVCSA